MTATNMLKGKDNITFDVIRVLALASFVVGMFLQIVAFFTGKPFDMQAYGIGIGIMFASVGAGLKLKENTEPTDASSLTSTSTTTATVTEVVKP